MKVVHSSRARGRVRCKTTSSHMTKRRRTQRTPKSRKTLGTEILKSIHRAIKRTTKATAALPIPGEGEERPFRNWLGPYLLTPVLGWPEDRIRIGEGFDILLLDANDKEVVTIETKAPFHRTTPKERKEFEERLSKLPRLRAAYLTNGAEWDRLDLIAPEGVQEVRRRESFDISKDTPEKTESFFLPLLGNRYVSGAERNRSLVTRSQPHILEQLANDLGEIVADVANTLMDTFPRYDMGEAGAGVQTLTRAIFDDWCQRSLQTPVRQLLEAVQTVLRSPEPSRAAISGALRDQGFTPQAAEGAADRLLAIRPSKRTDTEALRSALRPSYEDSIYKLCAQSAHLLLGRFLVYRVGEDMGLFDPLLGGAALEGALSQRKESIAGEPLPALALTETVSRRMLDILPLVYQSSDLDWWRVPDEKKETLERAERAIVRESEGDLDLSLIRMLRTLDGFHFGSVDADVWRNVYQHYLPGEERQRLGGFFTHEDLVEFILDLAGYVPEAKNLCKKTVLDPACGSGAFVSLASARLLAHLSDSMDCHADIPSTGRRTPVWVRNKAVLDKVLSNIHAIDVHPFAAFLTTLNLTFLLLPLYHDIRNRNPTYALDFQVFSADSLEKPDEQSAMRDMFEDLNSRIQLTAESHERYGALLDRQFDFVVGNPPWGGVLKGPLAPVYNETKKRRFRREFPHAATGKYDVYGLFMERGLQLLADGGRVAMVTQDTYLDKEWAKGLRRLLASQTEVQYIVDLNPFGGLFFRAMNTPAITVFDKQPPAAGSFVAVTTEAPKLRGMSHDERRALVLGTVRESLASLSRRRRQAVVEFCTAARLSRRTLRETAEKGWDVRPTRRATKFKKGWLRATDILEPRQGVTPGACLDVFLMSEERARDLRLEKALVHRAIKTRETGRWHPTWQGRVLLYPYVLRRGERLPAFTVRAGVVTDALDFETVLDDREQQLRRGRPLDGSTAGDILEHRIALDMVEYRQAARYLVEHYSRLEGRIFKKKRLEAFGRKWYEYLWPRDPTLLLSKNRIVSPRLTREVKFSLDSERFLADDACQYLLPTAKTGRGREILRGALSSALGRQPSETEVLQYCLAFLNSSYAQELLTRRRPTPKGSYQISVKYLSEIPLVPPSSRKDAESILQRVNRLTQAPPLGERTVIEARLNETVERLLRNG